MKRNKFYLYIQSARHESPVVAININPSCHRDVDEKCPPRGRNSRRMGIVAPIFQRSIHGEHPRCTKGEEDYAINSD